VPKFVAKSSEATGLAWEAPAGGGKVLQVVNATYGTEASSTTSALADTGLSATITPTLATSQILVLVNQAGVVKLTGDTAVVLDLFRGASSILKMGDFNGYTNNSNFNCIGTVSACYLDSPATTSATTYKTRFASAANIATVRVQSYYTSSTSGISTITLIEIGA